MRADDDRPAAGADDDRPEPGADDDLPAELAERLRFNDAGLICAVTQEVSTREVLMVAWMDRVALARTLTTGRVWYYSRSRQQWWRKGDTSGHVQHVVAVSADCDGDSLLVQVKQVGAACHTGTASCFTGRELPICAPPNPAGGPPCSDGKKPAERTRRQ